MPLLLLHTTGEDSCTERMTPLTGCLLDDSWVISASKAGSTTDPNWFTDLMASFQVTIEFGAAPRAVTARVFEGTAREEIWTRQKQLMSAFAEYEARTDRIITVVVLERR